MQPEATLRNHRPALAWLGRDGSSVGRYWSICPPPPPFCSGVLHNSDFRNWKKVPIAPFWPKFVTIFQEGVKCINFQLQKSDLCRKGSTGGGVQFPCWGLFRVEGCRFVCIGLHHKKDDSCSSRAPSLKRKIGTTTSIWLRVHLLFRVLRSSSSGLEGEWRAGWNGFLDSATLTRLDYFVCLCGYVSFLGIQPLSRPLVLGDNVGRFGTSVGKGGAHSYSCKFWLLITFQVHNRHMIVMCACGVCIAVFAQFWFGSMNQGRIEAACPRVSNVRNVNGSTWSTLDQKCTVKV